MADKLVYSSYGSGGGSKSAIRKWYEQMVPSSRHMERAKHHLTVTGEAIRGGGEGLIIGAALGAVHASLPTGLDIKVPMGTGKAALLPADAVLAALALVGSAAMGPNDAVGTDLRNSGIAAASVFSFRKTADFIAAKRAATGKAGFSQLAAHGEDGSSWSADAGAEDPIVAAARRL
jgi:hypothetical protein